jgi:DNA helicase-2/ATP-dependent DNA helicase PcrA
VRFYERREVREARQLLGRSQVTAIGAALLSAVRDLFTERLGYEPGADTLGDEARERAASLDLLLAIAADLVEHDPGADVTDLTAELDRRDAAESDAHGSGVNLLTYHRAKGLEWDAVFLPNLDEGLLPIRQARTDEQEAEERRLLYVGITRARTHLALSWSRKPSRFLAELRPRTVRHVPSVVRPMSGPVSPATGSLLEALQVWRRERAKRDAVPAYVVAHDSTLAAIAGARPTTIAALRRIKGMGPVKLDSYGAEILATVAADPAGPPG